VEEGAFDGLTGVMPQRCSYIAGKWAEGGEAFAVENPADESPVADVCSAHPAEVERAIAEARRSFDEGGWADAAPRERARVLRAFLDHIETYREALVATMVAEAGQPVFFAGPAKSPAYSCRSMADTWRGEVR
jgi:aldehyde dehydrogenase (NAD+)